MKRRRSARTDRLTRVPAVNAVPQAVRVAVVLLGSGGASLARVRRLPSGRATAAAPRHVAFDGRSWEELRPHLDTLLRAARSWRAQRVVVALRPSLSPAPWRRTLAARLAAERAELQLLREDEEARYLFLGALPPTAAEDGVITELEPDCTILVRFRGRLMAATARLPLGSMAVANEVTALGPGEALVVAGSLARVKPAGSLARRRQLLPTPAQSAARTLKALLAHTGARAALADGATADGLARTLLWVALPRGR